MQLKKGVVTNKVQRGIQMDFNSGIYVIRNTQNKKVYIGQSVDLKKRKRVHLQQLKDGIHYNSHLQNSYNKYGSTNFTFEVVDLCEKELLNEREEYWIKEYNACDRALGFNKRTGGDASLMTEETKQKIRAAATGRKHTEKSRTKMSISKMGDKNYWYGKESPTKGKKHSPETIKFFSESRQGANNPMYGKARPQNIKEIISKKLTAFTEEEAVIIYKRILNGEKVTHIARELNVSHPTISYIKNKKGVYASILKGI